MTKVLDCFDANDPFDSKEHRLQSLSSGLVASDEVNCDNEEAVGASIMSHMDGVAFTDVVMKKANQVHTLAESKLDKIGVNRLPIDSSTLFSRFVIIERSPK